MSSILYPSVGEGEEPGTWLLNPWHACLYLWVSYENIWKILKASKQRKMCFQVFSLAGLETHSSIQCLPLGNISEVFPTRCSNHLSYPFLDTFFFSSLWYVSTKLERFKWWNIITHMGLRGTSWWITQAEQAVIQALLTSLGREKIAQRMKRILS